MTNVPNDQREMCADAYRVFDHFYNISNTIEDWEKVIDAFDAVCDKHHQHPLAVKLCCSYFETLEVLKGAIHH